MFTHWWYPRRTRYTTTGCHGDRLHTVDGLNIALSFFKSSMAWNHNPLSIGTVFLFLFSPQLMRKYISFKHILVVYIYYHILIGHETASLYYIFVMSACSVISLIEY